MAALLVSGGHTQLWQVESGQRQHLLEATLDDDAGEAFDKSAMLLGLSYPGGARLERLAAGGDAQALTLPSPAQGDATADVVAAFQQAAAGLARQLRNAIRACGAAPAVVVGGVAQNRHLQRALPCPATATMQRQRRDDSGGGAVRRAGGGGRL